MITEIEAMPLHEFVGVVSPIKLNSNSGLKLRKQNNSSQLRNDTSINEIISLSIPKAKVEAVFHGSHENTSADTRNNPYLLISPQEGAKRKKKSIRRFSSIKKSNKIIIDGNATPKNF